MKALSASLLLLCATLAGCGGGPVKRVSEPAASIQQLTVRADGSWSVDLRINNFSSVPMRFERVSLAVTVGGEAAGTLQGEPAISIGPESADIATLTLAPTSGARIAIGEFRRALRTWTTCWAAGLWRATAYCWRDRRVRGNR